MTTNYAILIKIKIEILTTPLVTVNKLETNNSFCLIDFSPTQQLNSSVLTSAENKQIRQESEKPIDTGKST